MTSNVHTSSDFGTHNPHFTFHFVHSLSGVVDKVKSLADNFEEDDYPLPGILGLLAERYLKAHDYIASAMWFIIHTFKESYGPQEFVDHLCPKGMPLLEAEYLFELITG
ncbi:hypothetical protein V8B97DRAFT_1878228 [Scleroderma yunnanense]